MVEQAEDELSSKFSVEVIPSDCSAEAPHLPMMLDEVGQEVVFSHLNVCDVVSLFSLFSR